MYKGKFLLRSVEDRTRGRMIVHEACSQLTLGSRTVEDNLDKHPPTRPFICFSPNNNSRGSKTRRYHDASARRAVLARQRVRTAANPSTSSAACGDAGGRLVSDAMRPVPFTVRHSHASLYAHHITVAVSQERTFHARNVTGGSVRRAL